MGRARMGEKKNAYRILVGKPEGKRPLGRPRRSWVDNIKLDLREIRWAGNFVRKSKFILTNLHIRNHHNLI